MNMKFTPYLLMKGNAKEAIAFYQEALGAELIEMYTFGGMPANPDHPLPEEAADLVSHALLRAGDAELMLSDSYPGYPYEPGNHITVCLRTYDESQARTIFEKLSDGGTAEHPLMETFFSPAFGNVTDRFGTTFTVITMPKPS